MNTGKTKTNAAIFFDYMYNHNKNNVKKQELILRCVVFNLQIKNIFIY